MDFNIVIIMFLLGIIGLNFWTISNLKKERDGYKSKAVKSLAVKLRLNEIQTENVLNSAYSHYKKNS